MRCIFLMALAVAAGLAAVVPTRAANPAPALTIFEPYGEGSITDRVVEVLRPALEKRLGGPVKVEHYGSYSLNEVAHAPADGSAVVVVGLLPVELEKMRSNPGVKISSLTPIAKLTGPESVALVVPEGSAIKSWADFAAAAQAQTLAIAFPGRDTAPGISIAMMQRALGVHFRDIIAQQRSEVLAALREKKAQAGFLETVTLIKSPGSSAPPVLPIVTFGAKRNPNLAQVPTFEEAIGPQPPDRRHNAITSAVGLFGPARMAPAVVHRVAGEFAAAGAAAKASGAIAASHIPIEIGDADLLRETMARDARVIEAVKKELVSTTH
jgi:tripartite-type tricarboxylate transporter receptor subunit TctC